MINLLTLKRYCNGDFTKIENYEKAVNDNVCTYDVHHRLETHFSDGTERPKNAQLYAKELKALDMYYNRPPEELIFLTSQEHRAVHQTGLKKSKAFCDNHSKIFKSKWADPEYKQYMSSRNSHMGFPHTDKWVKQHAEQMTGRHWYTDGKTSVFTFECPEGFKPGRTKKGDR